MSFFTNQTFVNNGDMVTSFTQKTASEATALVNSQGYQDFSTLSTWFKEDPMKNMLKLDSYFGQQDIARLPLFQDVIKHDAVLEVNGWEGSFHYQLPIETDNSMKTMDDTSNQELCGIGGSTFRIVLNRELSPLSTISCQGMDGDILVISDIAPVRNLGYGFEHLVVLAGAEEDSNKTYNRALLGKDIEYFEISSSAVGEYTEQLSKVHMPSGTNYMTCKFQLGAGQGVETWFTGKANSTKLMPGYTTASTQDYINELEKHWDRGQEVLVGMMKDKNGKHKFTVGSILEMLAIQKFTRNFNTSLMFQKGFSFSTSKGVIRYNEGLWRQMRRGFIHTYGRRGGFTLEDLKIVRDYVFKANPYMKVEDSIIRIKCGSELYSNIETLIQKEFNQQLQVIAPLLGTDRQLPVNPISGSLDALKLALIKAKTVNVPGIGWVEAIEDKTLDYMNVTDKNLRGMNPNGKDYTTYSGIIWDVTDQTYSNNAKLPEGVKAVGNNKSANIYMVRPEGESVYWGRQNGRYSQNSATDIIASSKTMTEEFFIYGFGSAWLRDPSKFCMIELEESQRKGYN